MANKYLRKHSIVLIINEMQNETTVKYHLVPVRMAMIKMRLAELGVIIPAGI